MTAGIKFEFTHRSDLDLAEAVIDDINRARFAKGDIKVMNGDVLLGTAGQLSSETVKSIPKGAKISLVADFNPKERIEIIRQVGAVNASVDPQGRNAPLFSFVG